MPLRDGGGKLCARLAPASSPTHLGLDPGFVHEDQMLGVKPVLMNPPAHPEPRRLLAHLLSAQGQVGLLGPRQLSPQASGGGAPDPANSPLLPTHRPRPARDRWPIRTPRSAPCLPLNKNDGNPAAQINRKWQKQPYPHHPVGYAKQNPNINGIPKAPFKHGHPLAQRARGLAEFGAKGPA